jgi:integrase
MRTTRHIPWKDLSELIEKMKADNNRLHLLATIQSLLGLRISDVLALTWKDLSSTDLTIIEGKTGKERKMIVTEGLQEAVAEEFKKNYHARTTDVIFMNKHKTGAISVSYINRALKKAFKKYDMDVDQVSTHAFRKTFCYKILEDNNFSDKAIFIISRLLNHSTISTTMLYLNLHEREENLMYESLSL